MTTVLDRMRAINERQAAIEADARRTNAGQFTASQLEEYQRLDAEYETLKRQNGSGRRSQPNSMSPFNSSAGTISMPTATYPEIDDRGLPIEADHEMRPAPRGDVEEWVNAENGEPVRCFSNRARISTRNDVSIGRWARGIATGDWRGADIEKAMNLSEGGAGGGHYLVPDELASGWIDLARAQSVLMRAGTRTVPMNSETLRIAKIETDPSFAVYSENTEISESDVTIGATQLVSRKIATIIVASREVLQDAPNAAQMLQQVMARALAAEIDRLGLVGDGGAESIQGLCTREDTGATSSVGGILMEDFITALTGVRENNYQPTAIILHPTIHSDAMALTTGDAVNAAKSWLSFPPHCDGIPRLESTAITTAYVATGDFSHFLMGTRGGVTMDVTNEANGAFEKHQTKFKIVQRLAFAITRPAAFHVLKGVTT